MLDALIRNIIAKFSEFIDESLRIWIICNCKEYNYKSIDTPSVELFKRIWPKFRTIAHVAPVGAL